MQTIKFAVLPGDGIGPEVMAMALKVMDHIAGMSGLKLDHTEADVGGIAIDRHGAALPESTLKVCRDHDAILFGSVGGPRWENLPPKEQPERAALLPLRKHFKLYANLRPGLLYPELSEASPLKSARIPKGIDMLCVRELTGGLYFGEPKHTRALDDGDFEAVDTMVYRKSEIERITLVAIEAARRRQGRICSVDKANVLETSVLWRKTVSDLVAERAPELELSHLYVDNAAMQLVRDPNQFDVIVTENMFGDILSDEMGVVCGSLGMLSSASLGSETNGHGKPFGLYEPGGGTAPDIAGKDLANPCAQILSAALMLRFSFDRDDLATRLETAVRETVVSGTRTADIAFGGASVSTGAMTDAILGNLS
ncbi:MAG: 3-isopropylmalate dehydrogenase [Verrucomicrobia bacterium]|nr:MAG: 3-isopropylmalate dehydrogenase [Verrucomicrobiota bacterium]